MKSIDDYDYRDKTVLLRVDINSPIDPKTKLIINENRIVKSLPTIRKLLEQDAKLAIIAHQGDTQDYQNLIPLKEHAEKLSSLLNIKLSYIDDVAGPAAQNKIKSLKAGEAVLLGNLRYLSEEISTFENYVKLAPNEMLETYLVRNLSPIIDYYVNDAFAAAHRNAPSMVAFQEIKPSAAGYLLFNEVSALKTITAKPKHPCVFILGGAKISDAFGMINQVLANGTADTILSCGITGEIMLLAQDIDIGQATTEYIYSKGLEVFIKDAREYLNNFKGKIISPLDLAFEDNSIRNECDVSELPIDKLFLDIGKKTISNYSKYIKEAETLFMNGPPGMYENALFQEGTKEILTLIEEASGYSVIGGGDTVTAATKYTDLEKFNYVCTAGGAMVRYLSGKKLPLMQAMEN
ncbi:MAG: phosphoglycerate kinase [Gammaproteobacteria bacterium TMED78]|nr:MAG: phosphoglycerate kinase [Gammaproteobacteria bacterium TMED78]|tara:strand:+ start:19986 stop:21206 length:1221 start_codon:yes stop_codon:yes gene_type:complete